jgi:hypothetical protein
MVSAAFGEHLRPDGVDLGDDRIIIERFRHLRRTPLA